MKSCDDGRRRVSLESVLTVVQDIYGGSFIDHNLNGEPYEPNYDGRVLVIMGDLSLVERDDDRADGGYILEKDLDGDWTQNVQDERVVARIRDWYPDLRR